VGQRRAVAWRLEIGRGTERRQVGRIKEPMRRGGARAGQFRSWPIRVTGDVVDEVRLIRISTELDDFLNAAPHSHAGDRFPGPKDVRKLLGRRAYAPPGPQDNADR